MEIVQRARHLRSDFIEAQAKTLTDEQALDVLDAFPAWVSDKAYAELERIRFDGKLYKCVQAHTSQADWTPDKVPALWTEVAKPGEIPEWKQPTGAQDAYMIGDEVRHNGQVWLCIVDNNVWEPGVYGWEAVVTTIYNI